MSYFQCGSYLGCNVDCSNAPWNWDRPSRVTRMVFLIRLARWWRESSRDLFSSMTSLRSANLTWSKP